jgi:hypothetical protein
MTVRSRREKNRLMDLRAFSDPSTLGHTAVNQFAVTENSGIQ